MDFLLDNVEAYHFNYKIIKEESHLMKLKNSQYYVTPNIAGDNFLFVVKKLIISSIMLLLKRKLLGI